MNLTKASIQNNRITGTALAVLAAAGLSAYAGMSRAEDPGFTVRTAVVQTVFPGASPERVELLVTDRIEEVVQEMPELESVTSVSKTGLSVIYVNVSESHTDMAPIWDKLRRKVDAARANLPEGIIGPFVNDEFGDVFGTILTITGDGFSYRELREIADEVRSELLLIEAVSKVQIHGGQEERVFVEYTNAGLAEVGLSPAQLQATLEARNVIIPGGYVTTGIERIALEPSGNFDSVDELRQTVVNLPGRQDVVYLEDIAAVRRGYVDPPQTLVTSNGVRALALGIAMRDGGNIIELGKAFQEVVSRVETLYPWGIEFDVIAFQPQVVEESVNAFVGSVLQSIAIVALVMLVTLGVRTGLIVASLIPMAMVGSLFFMDLFGIGLDQISLAALIIALGMLVDNAIVMSESIMVQLAAGKDRLEAAVVAANELRIPLLTSSLTTAAAFLPIFLAESNAGEYTASIFKVVTITLLCSWVLSLTMIPMLCFYFLRVKKSVSAGNFDTPFYRGYRTALTGVLRYPYLSIGVAAALLVVAVFGLRFVPNIFFPPSERPLVGGELRLPAGTQVEYTEQVVSSLEEYIRDELMADSGKTGVVSWASFIGAGAPRYVLTYNPEPPTPDYAYILMNTTDRETVDALIPRLEQFSAQQWPDLTATFRPAQLGPRVDTPIAVRLSGTDAEQLFRLVDAVKAQVASIPGTRNVADDWGRRTKKLYVSVNQPRARRAGVSSRDVAISLQTVLSGFETTQYREGEVAIPIVMRSVAADREDLGKIESLNIFAQATGASVPLKQVADVEILWEPSKIVRRNRVKSVTVKADLAPGVTATDVNNQLIPWLQQQQLEWPLGYRYEIGGEAEASGKSQASIAAKLPIAALIIVFLLVAQFNSIRRPLIILSTIPLGVIGVVIGLLLARSYFGFMTLLGIISLAGIVINNAIVLLDRIRIEIDQCGLDPARAVIEAAQKRLRPILLTTATTVGGLLPLWFGGGPMFEPMAITIIFGLLFATLLTLGFVPVAYSILFKVSFRDSVTATPDQRDAVERHALMSMSKPLGLSEP